MEHSISKEPQNAPQQKIREWIEHPMVERFVIGVIIVNAITLGLETSSSVMEVAGPLIFILDKLALSIFVLELCLRMIGHGKRFFHDPWRVFDFVIITIALVPAGEQVTVLRALRMLRVFRLLTIAPKMRQVVGALLSSIPGLSSIILLLALVYYVFAVMATNLFGTQFPQWFGSITESMYSLFQIMTLESWSMGIVRPIMDVYPLAWIFFVTFILISTFTMLNLFIAVIVDAMQGQNLTHQEEASIVSNNSNQPTEQNVHQHIQAMHDEIRQLRQLIEESRK